MIASMAIGSAMVGAVYAKLAVTGIKLMLQLENQLILWIEIVKL